MALDVPANLLRRAAPRSGARCSRGAAALAGAKAGGKRLGCGAKETHVAAQRAAACACWPAKDARGRHAVEKACLRIADGELLPCGVSPPSVRLRTMRPRISRFVGCGFCRLWHG